MSDPAVEAVTDIESRIAEVLDAHGWHENGMECVCGYGPAEFGDWNTTPEQVNAHLAAVLVKELGLKQERTERAAAYNGEPTRHVSRWVTDWSRDE